MKPPARPTQEPVDEARAFRFSHGAVARSLADFERALREAPPGVVWFHREHFAPWLREVMGDEPLARRFDLYSAQHVAPDVLRDLLADLVETRVRERAGLAPTA